MGLIKNYLLKRKLKQIKARTAAEKALDEELRATTNEYNRILKEAEKRNKLLEAQRRAKQLKQDVLDEYDDDEDDDEDDDIEKDVWLNLFGKYLENQGKKDDPLEKASLVQKQAIARVLELDDDKLLKLAKKFK